MGLENRRVYVTTIPVVRYLAVTVADDPEIVLRRRATSDSADDRFDLGFRPRGSAVNPNELQFCVLKPKRTVSVPSPGPAFTQRSEIASEI